MKSSKLMHNKREAFYINWPFLSLYLSVRISGKSQMYRQTDRNKYNCISKEYLTSKWIFHSKLMLNFNLYFIQCQSKSLTDYLWNLFPKELFTF